MSAELWPCAIAEIGSSATNNLIRLFTVSILPLAEVPARTESNKDLLPQNVPAREIVNKNLCRQI
jgi:hypothetical protein